MGIDAKRVKELRELTGLPMMVCKKALEESDGDVAAAQESLRKAGEKVMEAKAGRQTKDGRVGGFLDPTGAYGVLVSVRCESEPVAKCEDFVNFHDSILEAVKAAQTPPASAEELLDFSLPNGKTVRAELADLVGKIRENIQIGDVAVLRGETIFQYIHFDNRHGSMVALKGAAADTPDLDEVGKNLCMHVVFAKPQYLAREEIPAETVEKEREIMLATAQNDPKLAAKPPEIQKKIVEGKLRQFYQEVCLPEQPYVRDDKITVAKYVKQAAKGASVEAFSYVGLG